MSKSFEAQGIVHSIGETTEYGNNGFTKREFVLKLSGEGENAQYPNYVAMELIKDKCAVMDQYKVGDEVVAYFNLQGRLWQGQGKPEKCFTSLQAWRVEAFGAARAPAAMGAVPAGMGAASAIMAVPSASSAPAQAPAPVDPFNTHFSDDSAGLDDIPF
ncbi:MAG: DUF3127 domain-containing protein [Pseudomonadales bacterium]|nr:DUF3127 domain-containing protein [Pseudomonadales bacterium]